MGRPNKKKNYWEAMKREEGRIQARWRMISKKPFKVHVREFLENLEKNPQTTLEIAAIGATTVLVHGLILESPELQQKSLKYLSAATLLGFAGVLVQVAGEQIFPKTPEPQLPDRWEYWVAAFVVAYIVVRHGGQVIGLLEKGLGTIANLLLAA